MALFEFEDGHLVPAQFGYPVAQDLGPELVDAICQQVLQIVSRPLFPVTWRDMTGQGDEETPRLTALDVSGQIVSVEILKELDSETLITSLSRLAEVASISWSDLAGEYPSGPEGFRAGWAQFRDSMPPAVGPGPRLIIVAGEIDPSVRPALSILATSGVEVHLMNLRQMSNGRLFLDVNAVGPRLYGHAPQLLASASAAPEIVAPAQEDVDEVDADASVESDSETPTTRPTPKVAPHLRDVFTYPIDEEPPAPWRPASEEDEQDEAESADALESVDTAEQGEDRERDDVAEDRERDDVAEEGVDAPADEWAPVDEARAQDEHEATEPDAGDDHIETDERVEGDAVAEDGDEYAPESVEADRAEDADDAEDSEADAQDADERDADAHAEDVPESDLPESAEAAATQHSENEDTGELPDHEEPRAEESAEPDEDAAADEQVDDHTDSHTDDHTAAYVGEHAETETEPDEEGDDVPEHADEQENAESDAPRWEPPAHMSRRATRRAREESSELNDGGATEAATASSVDRADESPEVVQARAEGLPVLGRDESGLRTLAQILGEDTPLIARGELGLPVDLVLAASGAVSGAGLTYPSLDTLLTARGLGHIDVWGQVRIGDRLGPTLAEALDEVNREIVREYAQAPRGHRSAKH